MTPGLYLWQLREGSPAFLVRVFDGEAFPRVWYGTRCSMHRMRLRGNL